MKQQWTKWVGGIVLASGMVMQASAAENYCFCGGIADECAAGYRDPVSERQGCAGGFFICLFFNAGTPD